MSTDVAEQRFWEMGHVEPPDGLYPTIDDYARALEQIHAQERYQAQAAANEQARVQRLTTEALQRAEREKAEAQRRADAEAARLARKQQRPAYQLPRMPTPRQWASTADYGVAYSTLGYECVSTNAYESECSSVVGSTWEIGNTWHGGVSS